MNIDVLALKELPKTNPMAFLIFKGLSERRRNRWETDINRNSMTLLNKGFKIDQNKFIQTWKDLETLGAGVIVWGRNGNPNRFRWHYSLKDIGSAALNPEVLEIQPIEQSETVITEPRKVYKKKSKRGRPKGSKNKKTVIPGASGVILTIKDIEGKNVGISLETAYEIADRVSKLKEITTRVA